MSFDVDPDLERRIRDEVERFAEILDKDAPPISFEEVEVLGYPAHSSFRDDTLLISPQSVQDLCFDQIRTSIAYTLAVLVRVNKMYRRTVIAPLVGAGVMIVVLVLTAMQRIPGLVSVSLAAVVFVIAKGRKQRSWQRISESDKLVYQLVGDLNPVIEFIQTTGFRRPGFGPEGNEAMMERRIAALRSL